jgi:hypothetical protein
MANPTPLKLITMLPMPTIIYKRDPFHYYKGVERGEKVETVAQFSFNSFYELQQDNTFFKTLVDAYKKAARVDASEAEAVLDIINSKTKH